MLGAGLVVGLVGASAAAAAAQPRAAGFQAGPNQPTPSHWRWTVKGTVAATPTPTSSSFTLDVAGCSTPQAIATNSSTTYGEPGTGLSPTAVTAGENVIVQLARGSSTLTARRVTILLATISGTVDSVGTSQMLVTDQQGFQRTIDLNVSGTTIYLPTGATVTSGDIVNAFGTVDSDHVALDAVAVHVHSAPTPPSTPPPTWGDHLSGVVASSPAPSSTSFVLDETGGATKTVTTNSNTKYLETGASSPPAGVVSGEHVFVLLVPGASTPTARNVLIILTELNGTVVSVGSTSFVLQDSQGFWRTVDVGSGTTYAPSGTTLAGLTGDHVVAFGTVDPDLTDLDARFVNMLPAPASTWSNTQPWKGVAAGCPVTPFWTGGTGGDPQNAGSSTGGSWSSDPASASASSGTRSNSMATGSSFGASHGSSVRSSFSGSSSYRAPDGPGSGRSTSGPSGGADNDQQGPPGGGPGGGGGGGGGGPR